MERLAGTENRLSVGLDRARKDLRRIAVGSAALGVAIFDFGLFVMSLGNQPYPSSIGTVAGVFIGIAVDLGIALGIYGVAKDLAHNN